MYIHTCIIIILFSYLFYDLMTSTDSIVCGYVREESGCWDAYASKKNCENKEAKWFYFIMRGGTETEGIRLKEGVCMR